MDYESLNLSRIVQNANSISESKAVNSDSQKFLYQKNSKKKKKDNDKVDEILNSNSEIEIYDQGEKKTKVGANKSKIDFQV